jgi:protocatechuate 3,4-dioxygenase beta subunit
MHPTPQDPSTPRLSRRGVLRAIVGGSGLVVLRGTAAAAEVLSPTPANALGPFYPARKPADTDADLTVVAGRTQRARGTILYIEGRVVDTSGRPLPNAVLELWQANAAGRYDHPGDGDSSGALDPNFQGYARLVTDAEGRYRIKTIKPAPYSGRTAHLHFNVAAGRARLTTQMFFAGEPANERDGLYRYLSRDDRIASTARPAARTAAMEPDALAAAWDVVLPT